jgi:4-hydroxymandelate oxidase
MLAPLAKLQQIPPTIAAVADYKPLARERVTEQAWAYVSGGSADEVTLRENCAAFQRLSLNTRVLQDLNGGHTRLDLFGRTFEFPILLAPIAFQKLVHPDGEVATVLAAAAHRAGMILSTQSSVLLEDVVRHAEAPLWFQLYIQADRGFTRELVQRAQSAGYQALVVTVDAPVNGLRNREQRVGFTLPPGIEAINLRGMRSPPQARGEAGASVLLGGPLLAAAPTWNDIEWVRSLTSLPVIVKGIMTGADAKRAVSTGVAAIVVSNHGGRTLDTQPSTISVLPEIADAVGGQVPLLLDGGIRRGADVFKALALGASAALIGRPYVYGLAAAGALGVSHVIHILRAELELTMALTGCRVLGDISPAFIRS